jgi:proliferating cell nuclear antigen
MASVDGTPLAEFKMFLRTVQAGAFKSVIESLEKFVSDINVEFRSDCVKFADLAKDNVAFAHVKLMGSKFEQYYCPRPLHEDTREDIPLICGINIPKFYKIIKTIQSTNMLTMYISHKEPRILCVNISGSDGAQCKTFAIRTLDVISGDYSFPSLIVPSVIRMSSTDFQKLCRDLNAFSDKVHFKMGHDSLELECESDWVSPSVRITDPTSRSQLKTLVQTGSISAPQTETTATEPGLLSDETGAALPSGKRRRVAGGAAGDDLAGQSLLPSQPKPASSRRRKGDGSYCAKFKQESLQTSDDLTVTYNGGNIEAEAPPAPAGGIVNSIGDSAAMLDGVYNLKYLCFFSRCSNFCPDVEMSILPDYGNSLILIYSASLGEVKFILRREATSSSSSSS